MNSANIELFFKKIQTASYIIIVWFYLQIPYVACVYVQIDSSKDTSAGFNAQS